MRKVMKAERRCGIKVKDREVGAVQRLTLDTGVVVDVYTTYRNDLMVMKKLFPNSIGLSISVIKKLREIHMIDKVLLTYEHKDGIKEHFAVTLDIWDNKLPEKTNEHEDYQKFVNLEDLKKYPIKVKPGLQL